jgi:hypothetical protein
MRRRLRAAILVLVCSPLAAMTPYHELDGLLDGFTGPCPSNAAWKTLVGSLVDENLNLTGRVDAPDALRQAFGAPQLVGDDPETGSVSLEVPVVGGAMRGVPIAALTFGFARDYPLIDYGIVFRAPADVVRSMFGEEIARYEADNPGSIVEHSIEDGDLVVLRCFATN